MPNPPRPLTLALFLLLLALRVPAADSPGAVRIASGGGHFAAGVQLSPGTDGSFELFSGRLDQQAVHPLGRYNGLLAGVGVDSQGRALALTRDGALNAYGDETAALALPDSRWNMTAFAVRNGQPVAVNYDGGNLYLARPDGEMSWKQEDAPIAPTPPQSRCELVVMPDDTLHLLWTARPEGLAAGGVRHAVLKGETWEEAAPILLGNAAGFSAFQEKGELHIAALTVDPLGAGIEHAASKVLREGKWRNAPLPAGVRNLLENGVYSFAATGVSSGNDTGNVWLSSGANGAVLTRTDADGETRDSTLAPAGEGPDFGIAPRFASLLTVAMICLLLYMYCRRSRIISKNHPERAPDLLSRAAALGIDWMLASFAMGAYHWASGDVRILPDLMRLGKVEGFFWSNLAGLAFFMLLSEAAFGTTPGKHLAWLRVASVYGGRPGVMQAVMRNLLRVVDMYPVSGAFPGLVGMVAIFLNRGRQRVGDMLAGTMVKRHLPLDKRGFLLASASPRRLTLLRELGVKVRVDAPDIDEDAIKGDTPEETVRLLAEAKAKTMLERARPPELVVAADTVVVIDGDILGKPSDEAEAVAMLRRLAGRSHSVFTGVTIWDSATGRGMTDVEETEVEFRALTEHEIAVYVASGDPLDKAGAYGIQSGHLVRQVRGSLSNVAGLPMEKLQQMVEQLSI